MFTTKKKKIQKYLEQKSELDKSVFDVFLSDYLDGTLKQDIEALGIKKAEIHIDWLTDIKCIAIQGRYNEYYMNLEIDPDEFSISFDIDEADEDVVYALESKEQVYTTLANTVKAL